MIGLTHITKTAYKQLVKESQTKNLQKTLEPYGVGWMFRLQGILCASATEDAYNIAKCEGIKVNGADDLFEFIKENHIASQLFEMNEMEDIKPGKTTLEMMVYSMCQAKTGDYGEE